MRRALEAAAVLLFAAAVGTTAALAHRRQREAELSPYPGVENTGPRGLAALHAWLAETGRAPLVISGPEERPLRGATVILATPAAALEPEEAEALLEGARRGGLLVWAAGPEGTQPELEQRLELTRPRSIRPAPRDAPAVPLAPHPLVARLSLRPGGGAVLSRLEDALPVAGEPGRLPAAAAVSVPWGRGEVLILAGAALLENASLSRGDNLELWARASARGPVVFDERYLRRREAAAAPSTRALAATVLQALAAALTFFWARGRRLGAVRPPPAAAPGRTAADYLHSLAALYRLARAEPRLAQAAWRRFRGDLQRRLGLPAALPDEEAAARLERSRPRAAAAFRRAALARRRAVRPGGDALLALTRAIAEVETILALTLPIRAATVGANPATGGRS